MKKELKMKMAELLPLKVYPFILALSSLLDKSDWSCTDWLFCQQIFFSQIAGMKNQIVQIFCKGQKVTKYLGYLHV